mgnify:CR=1 FL=1
MNEILPSVGDDTCDFYEARAIYHHPCWDGFQHHVAARSFTTRELCIEVKRIMESLTLRMYLDRDELIIVRHFITWFTNATDVPWQVWIDLDEQDGRRIFYYETFAGVLRTFKLSGATSIPNESLRASQAGLLGGEDAVHGLTHIRYEVCQLGSCGKPSTHRIPVKAKSGTTTSLDVCDEHFEKMEQQRAGAEVHKERKRVERAELSKLKQKVPRKKQLLPISAAP